MSKKIDDIARWPMRSFAGQHRTEKGTITAHSPLIQPPKITTVTEKYIRDYRDQWDQYYLATGEKRARAVSDCLTSALIEGGVHP